MNKEGASFSAECPVGVSGGCVCPDAVACQQHLVDAKRSKQLRVEKALIDDAHEDACKQWREDHNGLTCGFTDAIAGKNVKKFKPVEIDEKSA